MQNILRRNRNKQDITMVTNTNDVLYVKKDNIW